MFLSTVAVVLEGGLPKGELQYLGVLGRLCKSWKAVGTADLGEMPTMTYFNSIDIFGGAAGASISLV